MTNLDVDCTSSSAGPATPGVPKTASTASLSPYCGQNCSVVQELKNVASSSRPLSRTGSDTDDYVKFEVGAATSYTPLHERINRRIRDRTPFFSLEFFPPKTVNGVANFYTRLDRYREGDPLFVDITWHYSGDPANIKKETSSSSIAAGCLDYCRMDTMLHMTCVQYTKEKTLEHLDQCKTLGLRNIMALRGDVPAGINDEPKDNSQQRFMALDMIKWIKEAHGDYFTVACSGYPLGHPEASSYTADLQYLKAKVDAGAQLIVTQLFFEAETFEKFVRDCREIGITVPILPGIMPIQSYETIRRVADLSQLKIPESILADLEPLKNNDDAVQNYGRHRAVAMCRRILANGSASGIHLYTMNREGNCRDILQELGLWKTRPMRTLPWEPHGNNHPLRCKEDVRPIFWSARPKSYIYRTRDWDEFPNGRWGNSSSPAFNDLQDYYLFNLHQKVDKEKQLAMFGNSLKSIDDIGKVFVNYIQQTKNENGVKVTTLPWNEGEGGVQPETGLIRDDLIWCNSHGVLTLNSQPSVNGVPSTDPLVGWGKPGGYCYQKAYLECFIPSAYAHAMLEFIEEYGPRINYHVINRDGSLDRSNCEATTPIAVTWGVFPGAEIAQPTVVDPISFRVWRDEAYEMWMRSWAYLYPKESQSYKVIEHIHDTFYMLTLVDNDFVQPSVLFDVIRRAVTTAQKRQTAANPVCQLLTGMRIRGE